MARTMLATFVLFAVANLSSGSDEDRGEGDSGGRSEEEGRARSGMTTNERYRIIEDVLAVEYGEQPSFYAWMNVSKDSSDSELKKAYRRLSREL